MKSKYHSPTLGTLSLNQVASELKKFMAQDPRGHYTLVIGTDSTPSYSTDYVTAIVIHRKGKGGRYFWKRTHYKKVHTLREQIYLETQFSIETAEKILQALGTKVFAKYNVEIHIDVGTSGPTRDLINEVTGMVRGNGFTPKTKPESYAASTVADRYT